MYNGYIINANLKSKDLAKVHGKPEYLNICYSLSLYLGNTLLKCSGIALSPCEVGGYFSHSENEDHKVLKNLSYLSNSKVSTWSCQEVCNHSALCSVGGIDSSLLRCSLISLIFYLWWELTLALIKSDLAGEQREYRVRIVHAPSSRIRTVSNPYPQPCASAGEERSFRK